MTGRARNTVLTLLALLTTSSLQAQEKIDAPRWNLTLLGGAVYVPNTFTWRNEMMSTYVYPAGGVQFGWQTTEEDSPYAALYGYPNFGIGLGWEGLSTLHYNGPSRLGDLVNLYGFAERTLLRGERVSLDFVFDLGAGYNRTVYDPVRNPLNRNFGSHLLLFVSGGLAFRVALTDRWEAGLSAQFNHYSTGRLAYPNGGLNTPVGFLSMRYRTARTPRRHSAGRVPESPARFFYEVYAGGGIHQCATEWLATGMTSPWPVFSFGASANYRYRPHLSTGLAVDMYYATDGFLHCLEESERTFYGDDDGPYGNFSGGIGIIQHLHYGPVSAFATVGAYLYRNLGQRDHEGKFYQRIGLKYVLPGRTGLFIAADCKAHKFSRASMMELTVGVRF